MFKNDVDHGAEQEAKEETLSIRRRRNIVCCSDALESVGDTWMHSKNEQK